MSQEQAKPLIEGCPKIKHVIGYVDQVIKEAFLEIFHNGCLLDLHQQHHVLHPTGLLATTLPMIRLQKIMHNVMAGSDPSFSIIMGRVSESSVINVDKVQNQLLDLASYNTHHCQVRCSNQSAKTKTLASLQAGVPQQRVLAPVSAAVQRHTTEQPNATTTVQIHSWLGLPFSLTLIFFRSQHGFLVGRACCV